MKTVIMATNAEKNMNNPYFSPQSMVRKTSATPKVKNIFTETVML